MDVKRFIREHPFLLLGLITLSSFLLVEALNRAGLTQVVAVAAVPLRVLIIPMYVVWLLVAMIRTSLSASGSAEFSLALLWVVGLVGGLIPYALADYVLARWRRCHGGYDAAT